MKTKEFIEKVESLGLEVHDFMGLLEVRLSGETFVAAYKNSKYFGIYDEIDNLLHSYKLLLLKWLIEYVETPIEEREEPKKYYLRLPNDFIGVELMCSYYLNFNKLEKKHFFDTKLETTISQTQFTQAEIDKLDTTHLIKEEVK